MKTAVVIFTYGRLEHTKVTLTALSKNINFKNFPIIVFSDGPKKGYGEKVNSVRMYLRELKKKYSNIELVEREKNFGLEKSIITGITEILKKYSAVIVVEDDIKTSPYFLQYMETLLNKYKENTDIGCISGYNAPEERMHITDDFKYDIYFAPRTCSWGWATWRDRWEDIDWEVSDIDEFINNKDIQKEFNQGGNDLSRMLISQVKKGIDTWDSQWCYHNFKKNRYTIYPVLSYVENIGMDGTGVHCGKTSAFENENLNKSVPNNLPEDVVLDKKILRRFKRAQSFTPKMFVELAYYRTTEIVKSFWKK